MSKTEIKPTAQQRKSFLKSISFGVLFVRSKPINKAKGSNGKMTEARNPGQHVVLSVRRFGSSEEANIHGRRFKRIEGHHAFYVVILKSKPNAWVNLKTGKTNPLIGAKRTNRR